MAKLKKGTLRKTTDRTKCQRLLKKAQIDVYVPRPSDVWKVAEEVEYICVFEGTHCVQAYLVAKNKYKKALTPYVFWDVAQQRAFEKKSHTERFLSETVGEQQHELILKMQKYYHILKEKGRF